jgi:hypothetical protein
MEQFVVFKMTKPLKILVLIIISIRHTRSGRKFGTGITFQISQRFARQGILITTTGCEQEPPPSSI